MPGPLLAQVSFQWKNPDFLSRNPDFLLKSVDFIIINQVYAQLSSGFHAFMQCKKLVDTPFPFPYAQMLSLHVYMPAIDRSLSDCRYAQMVLVFLIILTVVLPVQVCIIVNSTPLAMALTFVTIWAFCGINEVAMVKMMDFVLKMMNFVFKMMNFVFKMMTCGATRWHQPEQHC